jgi:hypothetical protein
MYICINVRIYNIYKGLCQSRLSTTNDALLLIAPATTAFYSLERSYAWPPPSLSLLYFGMFTTPFPNNINVLLQRRPHRKHFHRIVASVCVLDCLQSCCLATRWSNMLQYYPPMYVSILKEFSCTIPTHLIILDMITLYLTQGKNYRVFFLIRTEC